MTLSCLRAKWGSLAGAAALGAWLAGAAACSSSADMATFGVGSDGGEDGAGPDGSGGDGGAVDAGFAIATLVLVHASPDVAGFRVCFGESPSANPSTVTFRSRVAPWPSDNAHLMAQSNYAGIAPGGGAAAPSAIVPVTNQYLVAYVIDAATLAIDADPTLECAQRVGPQCAGVHCLKQGDYHELPAIPSSMLTGSSAVVLAIAGCASPAGAACGTSNGGRLNAEVLPLSNEGVQAVDQIGVQLAHVAPAIGSVTATIDDAGVSLAPLQVGPPNGVIVTIPGTRDSLAWGARDVTIRGAADGGVSLTTSLADIQRVSNPSLLPSELFLGGQRYALVIVGDPASPNPLYVDGGINPRFDGTALHVVAIGTAPPPAPDGG